MMHIFYGENANKLAFLKVRIHGKAHKIYSLEGNAYKMYILDKRTCSLNMIPSQAFKEIQT